MLARNRVINQIGVVQPKQKRHINLSHYDFHAMIWKHWERDRESKSVPRRINICSVYAVFGIYSQFGFPIKLVLFDCFQPKVIPSSANSRMGLIEFAPLNIPLERRLQTLTVLYFCTQFVLLGFLSALFFLYLLTTQYYYISLLYYTWFYFDRKTYHQGFFY